MPFYALSLSPVHHEIVMTGKPRRIAHMAHYIFFNNASGHYPLGIDVHAMDTAGEQGCFCLAGTTPDTHFQRAVGAYSPQMKRRQIDHDISLLVLRIGSQPPSATLHIDEQPFALLSISCLSKSLL